MGLYIALPTLQKSRAPGYYPGARVPVVLGGTPATVVRTTAAYGVPRHSPRTRAAGPVVHYPPFPSPYECRAWCTRQLAQ